MEDRGTILHGGGGELDGEPGVERERRGGGVRVSWQATEKLAHPEF